VSAFLPGPGSPLRGVRVQDRSLLHEHQRPVRIGIPDATSKLRTNA